LETKRTQRPADRRQQKAGKGGQEVKDFSPAFSILIAWNDGTAFFAFGGYDIGFPGFCPLSSRNLIRAL
jgi:hypothetical protein